MSNHPVLVKGAIGSVLGMSVDMALILGLHLTDLAVVVPIAVAVGILSGFAVNIGMPGLR